MIAPLADISAAPVIGLMALGFVMALIGHIVGERRIVAVGIGILFLATLLMLIAGVVAFNGHEVDPRPAENSDTPF